MNQKCKSDLLDNLYLAAPCSIAWDAMIGDERKRLCTGCSRNVYNVSDMTRREAEGFLQKNGSSQCMIFYRRADGTVMTDNCPVGLRKLRDRAKFLWHVAASAVGFVLSLSACLAQSTVERYKPGKATVRLLIDSRPGPSVLPPGAAGGAMIPSHRLSPRKPMIPVNTMPVDNGVLDPGVMLKPSTNKPSDPIAKPGTKQLIDRTAMESFRKGEVALAAGKKSLAEFHFEKALEAFERQTTRDVKFRQLIEENLKKTRDTNH